jgi:hypothetical protein
MQKSLLLAALKSEIQRHDFSHFVDEPPVLSSHFVKSISLTSCSTRTSATDTLTTLSP